MFFSLDLSTRHARMLAQLLRQAAKVHVEPPLDTTAAFAEMIESLRYTAAELVRMADGLEAKNKANSPLNEKSPPGDDAGRAL